MGPGHAYSVGRLAKLMVRRFGELAHVSVQGPIASDAWSEPQPDVMLSAPPDERYATVHPKPEDALLVIEVALSSLRFDAGSKLRAYARRGVREYWIVDLVHERIDVHREEDRAPRAGGMIASCFRNPATLEPSPKSRGQAPDRSAASPRRKSLGVGWPFPDDPFETESQHRRLRIGGAYPRSRHVQGRSLPRPKKERLVQFRAARRCR